MSVKLRFDTLLDLLCKYDQLPVRDLDLLNVLKIDIQSECREIQSWDQPNTRENVFLKMLLSTSVSIYSKVTRFNALVRNGFDKNAIVSDGLNLLRWLVENKGDDFVEFLTVVIPGNDLNVAYSRLTNRVTRFLLLTAVEGGKIRFVQALLTAGAKVDLNLNSSSATPTETLAYAAAKQGHHSILKLLIENEADTKKAYGGKTPLVVAAEGVARGGPRELQYQRCVELLVPPPPPPPPPPAAAAAAALAGSESKRGNSAGGGGKAKRGKMAECTICMAAESEIAFLPCGHLCVCSACVVSVKNNCPMCRKKFTSTAIIYIP